jgi:hypothetical protein
VSVHFRRYSSSWHWIGNARTKAHASRSCCSVRAELGRGVVFTCRSLRVPRSMTIGRESGTAASLPRQSRRPPSPWRGFARRSSTAGSRRDGWVPILRANRRGWSLAKCGCRVSQPVPMRPGAAPKVGFSRTISPMSARRFPGTRGLPPRGFQRQKSCNALRCQPTSVSGFTTTRARLQAKHLERSVSLAVSDSRRGLLFRST